MARDRFSSIWRYLHIEDNESERGQYWQTVEAMVATGPSEISIPDGNDLFLKSCDRRIHDKIKGTLRITPVHASQAHQIG